MVRIAHLADIHLRTTTRHGEYRIIFDKVYSILQETSPNVIIIAGDLAHSKTNISPEYVKLASEFLKTLADISPTKLILGNHDKLFNNSNRLDAVSPVVDALNHPNLQLYLKSGEYNFDDNVVFNVMNVFEKDEWIKPTDENKINIALYHGSISGCDVDSGYSMLHGEDEINIFDNFDYVMAGDIHLQQRFSKQQYEEIEVDEEELEHYLNNGWRLK